MGIGNCGTHVKGSGKDQTIWKLEWTFGASGAVTLDTAQSDQHPDIATPVADGGAGIVDVVFPKCSRAWVLHRSIEAVTVGTGDQLAEVYDLNAAAGTATFNVLSDALAVEEATNGARARLILLLERP